jgi:hypothetical protein
MGPESTFLETYLEYHYRKAKKLQAMARAQGITPEKLNAMAKEDAETVEFKLNINEGQNGTKISI